MTKWRGIPTTQVAKNEVVAKTIINRLGQKSMSLPRIDDKKRWAGYPGLAGTAKKIAKMIPNCLYYVEPFAGSAKVCQELINRFKDPTDEIFVHEAILNDKSPFVYDWLRKELGDAVITNQDFVECFNRWNDENTVFVFDGPWNKTYYQQSFSWFDRKDVKTYDEEIVELCKKCRGKFIIASRKENKVYLNSGFKTKLVESIYPVSGKLPKVLISHNIEGI